MEEFKRSKDPRLGKGSLWAALPIPACRALTYAGQGAARDVLVALVLHSNDRSPRVFPSRPTIIKYSGVGKNSITGATKVLVSFGFIKVFKISAETMKLIKSFASTQRPTKEISNLVKSTQL